MNNRKLRFNLVDVLILLLIAAVIFAALYIFVLRKRGNITEAKIVRLEYVMEFVNLDGAYEKSVPITAGQPVVDTVSQKRIGTVKEDAVAVQYEKIGFDKETETDFIDKVEGRVTLQVTIQVDAYETEKAFSVEDREIRAGEQYSLMFPDFYGVGYCIQVSTSPLNP